MKTYNLTINDIKKMFGVEKATIYAWIRKNEFPSVKIGGGRRFNLEDVETWVKKQTETKENFKK